jgi:hypothetical protein
MGENDKVFLDCNSIGSTGVPPVDRQRTQARCLCSREEESLAEYGRTGFQPVLGTGRMPVLAVE